MPTAPFRLPLDAGDFAKALHKGQGRALIHVRQFGSAGLDSILLDAVLNNRTYDPQCEGDRTPWLTELIDAADSAELLRLLLPRLGEISDDYWTAMQRCKVARAFAERGEERARAAVYAALRRWPDSDDVLAATDIVALDGADGLIYVAEFLGRLAREDTGLGSLDVPLAQFDEAHGQGAGRRILDAAARNSPDVTDFLRRLDDPTTSPIGHGVRDLDHLPRSWPAPPTSQSITTLSAVEVVDRIETEASDRSGSWCRTWGRKASAEDLTLVFEALCRETDPARLDKYLRVFSAARLARFDPRLLDYAEHKSPKIRTLAHRALSNYKHPAVRNLALARLNAGRVAEDDLLLLVHNYVEGDAQLLAGVLVGSPEQQQSHALVYDLLKVLEANPLPECLPATLFAYETTPCSQCRCRAARLLVRHRRAPEWLIEEACHDASTEIRELVAPTDSGAG